MGDRAEVALFLFVLLFGGFGAFALQAAPNVRFRWRWLAWSIVYLFGVVGALGVFAHVTLDIAGIAGIAVIASGAGALSAAGGPEQIAIDLTMRGIEERQKQEAKSGHKDV